jgi:hypothetical protein
MVRCPRGAIAVFDDRGYGLLVAGNGEWSPIPCAVKAAVMCTPIEFLVNKRGEHFLRVLQIVGQFVQSPSICASQCPVLKSRRELELAVRSSTRTKATCLELGMPLALKIIQARESPQSSREQMIVLRNLFVGQPQLLNRVVRYSYILGESGFAKHLFLGTNPDDPSFITNIMRAVVIQPIVGEAVNWPASELFRRGLIDEAVDLLLMTGNWESAATHLISLGMFIQAALIIRGQEPSLRKEQLTERVAVQMLAAGFAAYSVVIMGENGDFNRIAEQFKRASELAQAEFFTKVACE